MTVRNLTGFAGACSEAMNAVLDAIAAVGEERRGHLKDAKLAVGALPDSTFCYSFSDIEMPNLTQP